MASLIWSLGLALHYPRSRSPSCRRSRPHPCKSVFIRGKIKHQAAFFGRFSDRPYSGAFASARTGSLWQATIQRKPRDQGPEAFIQS